MDTPILECVVNINTISHSAVIDTMMVALKRTSIRVIHRDSGIDADRTVLTLFGRAEGFLDALIVLYDVAIKEGLDITQYHGNHPSVGIIDVVPFVPIKNVSKVELSRLVRSWADHISQSFKLPIIFYGSLAANSNKIHLSQIRKGGVKNAQRRLATDDLKPDYGPNHYHLSLGMSCWTVRDIMVAYNVSIDTHDVTVAKKMAKEIRAKRTDTNELSDVRVLGWSTPHFNCCQISANFYDVSAMTMKRFYHIVQKEAAKYDINILGSELIGVSPYRGFDRGADEMNMYDLVQELGLNYHHKFDWESRVLEKLI